VGNSRKLELCSSIVRLIIVKMLAISFRKVGGSERQKTQLGRRPVSDYRIYTLDFCGHFTSGEHLACARDEEAIELLQLHSGGEVWQGVRRVGQVPDKVRDARCLSVPIALSTVV
jgi:hypothetical protein